MSAPGAEQFVPNALMALWGPPERTFSAVGHGGVLRPERVRHVDVSLERELGSLVVAVRRFAERVDDQQITFFGRFDSAELPTDLGHYYVAAAGGIDVDGWSVEVSRPVGSRVRGSIEYTASRASFANWSDVAAGPGYVFERSGDERLHDLTGLVDTQIQETATRITAAYRVNSGFARHEAAGFDRGLDARFDVQVHQALPFLASRGGEWELLLAIRNMFHDRGEGAALYDELLVVRPPKRVLGGVSVKF
jgi:hypothetical protein